MAEPKGKEPASSSSGSSHAQSPTPAQPADSTAGKTVNDHVCTKHVCYTLSLRLPGTSRCPAESRFSNLQNTENAPSKAIPLKSPWAQIVKSEPKSKEQPPAKASAKPQLTKQGSNASAASGKQESQTALPSYAQAGVSQRQSSQTPADSKPPAPTISPEEQPSEAQPVDVDKHAPATPVASTSPVPHSDSSSSTAEKFREEGNAAEASTSREPEVTLYLRLPNFGHGTTAAQPCCPLCLLVLKPSISCRCSHQSPSRWHGKRYVFDSLPFFLLPAVPC